MGLKIRSLVYALATYTTYTTYSYVQAQREIERRENEYTRSMKTNDSRFDVLEIHGKYENPFKEYRPQTLYEFFVMRLIELTDIGRGPRGGVPAKMEDRIDELGWVRVSLELLHTMKNRIKENGLLGYIWLGQSCGLLYSSDKTFLMDPLFEDTIVNKWIGPKRIVQCPISLDNLVSGVKPNYILVSHDHPDHLGDESVEKISSLEESQWIVPSGIGKFLMEHEVKSDKIIEMKWWDRVKLDEEFEIVCLPAMHWSGRVLYDANTTLWCSFLILKNGKGLFYHGGDTGYVDGLFSKIGKEYGPIKFGALPIGQYCPEWHQKPRHISPMESIKIMKEMNIHKMVGVHWGTFVLSSENYLEPGELLVRESLENGNENNIILPNQGKLILMKEDKLDFNSDDDIEFEDTQCVIYK